MGGKYVQLFEGELSKYLNKPTVVVNSGTSALIMSLWLAGVRAGDEVIIPAYGFIATKNAVLALQAIPIYADIRKEDYCIDWEEIEIISFCGTNKIKAIITVDLYGNLADYLDFNIPVIEDACQALGTIKECRADYTCFSFYYSKIVHSGGEGGAIACNNPDDVRRLRTYPDGLNYRMPEINAAIGYDNLLNIKRIKPEIKHYNYTLSPPGECPNADALLKQ